VEPERVLVVDDEEGLLNLMVLHLQRRGYVVESAVDGLTGLQLLRDRGPFAVLVTDLMMPGMNGLELLREARKRDPRLEVIVISAAATLESAIAAMREDGAYDYLLKPLETINELSMAVDRAAAHRRLQMEREALQAKLAEEAERLQALIANTGDAILSANADGLFMVVNPAAARLLGKDDLVGRQALAHLPEPLATLVSNWQTVGGQRPTAAEVAWPDEATQMVNLTPIPRRGGGWDGWVMVMRDITHLKRQDDLKMQLLTEAAGKIRFPLAQTLVSLAELSDLLEAKGERSSEIIHRLVRLWDRIQEWLDDLLALVRIESGVGIHLAVVDLSSALEETAKSLAEELLQDGGLKLNLSLAPGLPLVRADPDLLRQLVHGLVNRAAVRCERGGEISIAASESQGQVWIDVSDSGPPMDEADLPHIFEKSFSGSGSSAHGTGLELAMAKTIVERLGGQIWVRGHGAVGSTIAVCLPAASRATEN
jgi:PAS domain S-box-containing protein